VIRAQLPVWSPVSGRMLASGLLRSLQHDPRQALERHLLEEYAARRALLTDSGTSALTLALRSLGSSPVVALPAYGCFDLATAAVGADAKVRFYDIDPGTLAPDEGSLRRALAEGVSGVVVAHFYGVPVDLRIWRVEVAAAGAVLIDDAAQAVGARFDGEPAGAGGDLGVLSFGRGKGRTGGHGGALLATSDRGLDLAAQLQVPLPSPRVGAETVSFGKLGAQWILGRPALYGIPQLVPGTGLGETVYHPPRPARSIGRVAAGVLLAGAEQSVEAANGRRTAAAAIRDRIALVRDAGIIRKHPKASPGWLRFPLLLSDRSASIVRSRQGRALGIMGGYPLALPELGALEGRVLGERREWPGASELVRGLVTLPTHRWVTERDLNRIVMLLEGAANGG